MINFITDLDDTLIYSKISSDNCICVEKYKGRDICFITEHANKTLKKLLSSNNFRMIPCTARYYEQTTRISFINEYSPEYMICDLGASIYINSKKDEEWEKYLLSKEIIYPKKIIKLREKIEKTVDLSECRKILSNNDYFLMFCFREDEATSSFYNKVNTEQYTMNKFSFRKHKTRVYCYPNKLDKSLAVSYLTSKIQLTNTITSGDSLFDYEFSKLGDIAILPRHSKFKIEKAIYCKEEGIRSGEYIFDYLYNSCLSDSV